MAPLEVEEESFKGRRWPLRLSVRHYMAEDEETGAVRIGASRLVKVFAK